MHSLSDLAHGSAALKLMAFALALSDKKWRIVIANAISIIITVELSLFLTGIHEKSANVFLARIGKR